MYRRSTKLIKKTIIHFFQLAKSRLGQIDSTSLAGCHFHLLVRHSLPVQNDNSMPSRAQIPFVSELRLNLIERMAEAHDGWSGCMLIRPSMPPSNHLLPICTQHGTCPLETIWLGLRQRQIRLSLLLLLAGNSINTLLFDYLYAQDLA